MTTTSTGGEVNLGLERKDGEGEGHSSSDSNLGRRPWTLIGTIIILTLKIIALWENLPQ